MVLKKYTVIGQGQARLGFKFMFMGSNETCVKCDRAKSCFEPLEAGRVYEVKNIKRKNFECNLHGPDSKLVVVEEVDYEANIESKSAVLNAVIRFEPLECDSPCPQLKKCVPLGLLRNDRCLIVEVGPRFSCPRRKEISSVRLSREAESSQTSLRKGRT